MSDIEEKTLEGVDGFFTKLTEAADIVTQKLIEVAPDAAEALLKLVQVKGGFNLVSEFLWVTVYFLITRWLYNTGKKFYNGGGYSDTDIPIFVCSFFAAVVPGILTLVMLADFLKFYDWLSVFYPEGAVALMALEAAGIKL